MNSAQCRPGIDSDFVPAKGQMKEGRCSGANVASFFQQEPRGNTWHKGGQAKGTGGKQIEKVHLHLALMHLTSVVPTEEHRQEGRALGRMRVLLTTYSSPRDEEHQWT